MVYVLRCTRSIRNFEQQERGFAGMEPSRKIVLSPPYTAWVNLVSYSSLCLITLQT